MCLFDSWVYFKLTNEFQMIYISFSELYGSYVKSPKEDIQLSISNKYSQHRLIILHFTGCFIIFVHC